MIPEGKGECLDIREQDLVQTQVFKLYQILWSFGWDHFALQSNSLKLNPGIRT